MADQTEKPAFDPSKPFEVAKPPFNPDAPHDIVHIPDLMVSPDISKTESALRGAAQGATLGFADELAGAGETAGKTLLGDEQIEDIVKNYKKHRDESRKNFKLAEETNPKTYLAGNVGGGLATALVPGASALTGIGGMALAGGVAGLGTSDSDLTNPSLQNIENAAIDTGKGAALGGVIGLAGKGISKYVGKEFGQGLKGNMLVGEEARRGVSKEAEDTGKNIAQSLQNEMNTQATAQRAQLASEDALGQTKDITSVLGPQNTMDGSQLDQILSSLPKGATPKQIAERDALEKTIKNIKGWTNTPSQMTADDLEKLLAGKSNTTLNATELNSAKQALGGMAYTDEVKDPKLAGALKQIYSTLKSSESPEKQAIDKKLSSLINAQDVFNTGGLGYDEFGQAKELTPFLKRLEATTDAGDTARMRLQEGIDNVKNVNPELASDIQDKALNVADKYQTAKDLNSSSPSIFGSAGKMAIKAAPMGANIAGYAASKANQSLGEVPQALAQSISKPVNIAAKLSGATAEEYNAPDVSKSPAVFSKNISTMDNDELGQVADRLSQDSSLSSVAEFLQKSIQNNNAQQKNAALFSIMQNPKARKLLTGN